MGRKQKRNDDDLSLENQLRRIDRYLWKQAWKFHDRLSPESRLWLDVEDLYQQAALAACNYYWKWDPNRSQFFTGAYVAVHNALDSYVQSWQSTQRRNESGRVDNELLENFAVTVVDPVPPDAVAEWLYNTNTQSDAVANLIITKLVPGIIH